MLEKPDEVVFLDKSARIFAHPIHKYLQKNMGEGLPKISFFNDSRLKESYLFNKDTDEAVAKFFEKIKNKKVFFIDETYSLGQGSAALKHAKDALKGDFYYFALSTDPHPDSYETGVEKIGFLKPPDEHKKYLDKIASDDHFIKYPTPFKSIFSRKAAKLYIDEMDGKTLAIRPPVDYNLDGELDLLEASREAKKPPQDLTWEEYEKAKRRISLETVRKLKQKILETIES
jgi:hypothetical protein